MTQEQRIGQLEAEVKKLGAAVSALICAVSRDGSRLGDADPRAATRPVMLPDDAVQALSPYRERAVSFESTG